MKFIKFLGVGAIATAIQYTLLVFIVEIFNHGAVNASIIAYLVSSVFNYLFNYFFTFSSMAHHALASSKFAVVLSVGLGINSLMMNFLVERYAFYYLVSQLASTVTVLIWNYMAHKYWTYPHF